MNKNEGMSFVNEMFMRYLIRNYIWDIVKMMIQITFIIVCLSIIKGNVESLLGALLIWGCGITLIVLDSLRTAAMSIILTKTILTYKKTKGSNKVFEAAQEERFGSQPNETKFEDNPFVDKESRLYGGEEETE